MVWVNLKISTKFKGQICIQLVREGTVKTKNLL